MKIPKPNRRSYKPHSAQATARRAAAGQYNWAIHQILGATAGAHDASKIASTIRHPNLQVECEKFQLAAREIRSILQDPEIRAAWMAAQEEY